MSISYDNITTTAWHTPMDFDGEECWVSAEIANEDSQFPKNYIEYGIKIRIKKDELNKKNAVLKSFKDELIKTIKEHFLSKIFIKYDGSTIKIDRPYIYNVVSSKWELMQ